jgi:hypothetical protein
MVKFAGLCRIAHGVPFMLTDTSMLRDDVGGEAALQAQGDG